MTSIRHAFIVLGIRTSLFLKKEGHLHDVIMHCIYTDKLIYQHQ